MPLLYILFLFFLGACGSQDGADTPFEPQAVTNPTPTSTDPTVINNEESTDVCKYDSNTKSWNSIDPLFIERHENNERYFAKGGGCVTRSLLEVLAVSHNRAGVKWRDADINGLRKVENESSAFFFEGDYSAGPPMFKQKWVIAFSDLFQGKPSETKTAEIQYQKVKGTKHIVFWKGKILLQSLSDTVTSVTIENEIEGTQINMEKAEGGVVDLLNNLRTQAPDWTYLKPSL